MKLLVLAIILLFSGVKSTKKPNFKEGRVGIAYLFEWPYKDIKKECEFLSAAGYGGVLIG
jgi:hypothetical protein